jgi:hypothetical protein
MGGLICYFGGPRTATLPGTEWFCIENSNSMCLDADMRFKERRILSHGLQALSQRPGSRAPRMSQFRLTSTLNHFLLAAARKAR